MRDPSKTLKLAESLLADDPQNAYAMNAKSCALAALGEFDAAIEWQVRAESDEDWVKDASIDGGAHYETRLATWRLGKMWHP